MISFVFIPLYGHCHAYPNVILTICECGSLCTSNIVIVLLGTRGRVNFAQLEMVQQKCALPIFDGLGHRCGEMKASSHYPSDKYTLLHRVPVLCTRRSKLIQRPLDNHLHVQSARNESTLEGRRASKSNRAMSSPSRLRKEELDLHSHSGVNDVSQRRHNLLPVFIKRAFDVECP